MLGEQPGGNAAQVEPLAAGEDRYRELVHLGCREEELHVGRWFLQRLEQRVESVAREHVDFVDDIDLVTRGDGSIAHRLDDLSHVVDAGVAGRVHLDHVDMAALGDGGARFAPAAGIDRRPALPVRPDAVQGLGDEPRGGGLADPAHAGHQECVSQPVPPDRVSQRLHHRILADQGREGLRTILAGEDAVRLRGGRDGRRSRRCCGGRRRGRGNGNRRGRRRRIAEHRRLSRGLKLGS